VDAHLPPQPDDAAVEAAPQADALPGFCPRCRGILSRARVDTDHPFHLDRCNVCRGVWFDAGEWAAVASTEWLSHIDDLWDPVWRKKVREHRAENRHHQTIEQEVGSAPTKTCPRHQPPAPRGLSGLRAWANLPTLISLPQPN